MDSSAEQPAAVRTVSTAIGEWIGRLGEIWVEGQVAELKRRPGMWAAYLTLRDLEVEMSLSVVVPNAVMDAVQPPVAEGQRIIVLARPDFYPRNGSLQLRAREIRTVGLGQLLAEIERLRVLLTSEGLFAAERKVPLPFLPRRIGLICGRASAAMRDVMVNAAARWPAVDFEVREVAVQGPGAVAAVVEALEELDRSGTVDVIVITRGGGSVEDLLPFSNERMVRAVAACRTPVVSAIGHEQDAPLIDFAADLRASTPTDAAKRIVPDVAEQAELIRRQRDRGRRVISDRLRLEQSRLNDLRRRPVLATPVAALIERKVEVLHQLVGRVRALSPQATLDRGYAVVQAGDGRVIRAESEALPGADLRIRVASGQFSARRVEGPPLQ